MQTSSWPWISLPYPFHIAICELNSSTQLEEERGQGEAFPGAGDAPLTTQPQRLFASSPWMLALHTSRRDKDLLQAICAWTQSPKDTHWVLGQSKLPPQRYPWATHGSSTRAAQQLTSSSVSQRPKVFLTRQFFGAPGHHCTGSKICSHRAGLFYVSLSSQSPEDDLIAWENVLFNLLELVISSSLISLYFWLERLKILIYQWHL